MSPLSLAYLDPGTGSVILQALVGGVAGIVVIAKMGGRKFLSFLPIIGKRYRQDFIVDGSNEAGDDSPADDDTAGDDTADRQPRWIAKAIPLDVWLPSLHPFTQQLDDRPC